MDTARYVVGVLLVVGLPPAVVFWLVIHPLVRFWRRIGPGPTYVVTATACTLLALVLYGQRTGLMGADLGTSWMLIPLGAVLYLASGWLSFVTRRQLKMSIFAGLPELAGDGIGGVLLESGAYGWVRHPRYLSVFIGITGCSLFVNYVGIYMLVAGSFFALYGVIVLEEQELAQRFGVAYERYRSRVPALVPRFWKGGRTRQR